jgi:hypothetical protein
MRLFLFILAAGCAWVWMLIAAPLVCRAFGVPCNFGFWRIDRRNQHLRPLQYFWCIGVFGFGLGMFIFLVLQAYGTETVHGTIGIPMRLVIGLTIGIIWGLLTSPKSTPQ